MDTFTRMRSFVAVVDSGGFSAAARGIGRSKALLSKYTRQLEDDLGVRLLNRTTRTLSLTEAGRAYYREAQDILQRINDLESSLRDVHNEPRGTLRVSAPRTLGDGALGEAIMAFVAAQPNISLDLSLDDRFVDLVDEGFDAAVRIAELADSSLVARRLAPFRVVLVARPDFIERHGRPQHPLDLARAQCIVDTNARARATWHFNDNGTRVNVTVTGRVEVNSPNATRAAALAGLGFARVPYLTVRKDIEEGRLVTLLEDYEPNGQAIHVVYPSRRHLSGKVRAFVDHLVNWFSSIERNCC